MIEAMRLFHTERGQGPTCLVLSSIGTRPYERQLPAQLDQHLRLVFVDLRGSGRSPGEASDLTFDVLAADLEAVRRELGVDRVAVLGHSILGVLAIEYGRRCPDTVSHVITVGTPPFGDMTALVAKATAFFEQDASDERKRLLRENLAALPPNASPTQFVFAQTPMRFFDPRTDAAPLFEGAVTRPQFLAHVMGTLARGWDITVDPDSLRVPILVDHGRHDYVVPYVLWDDIPAQLPHAKLRLFEQSGHQPFFEEPDEFNAAVTAWMGIHR
jgi:proline iminopeptidase